MKYKYKFTIFTPCYNSAGFINRVYDSLSKQTYRSFEWLVVNDASTDNTHEIIQNYIGSANFDIRYFNLEKNQMLTRNYNLAIKEAQGEFFIPLGHDDECFPHALQTFLDVWEKYGKDEYAGVSCLCMDQFKNLVGDKFPESPFISNYIDVTYNLRIRGEKWGFIRTDVIRKYMLPENIDTYISEGLMWMKIALDYSTIFVNEVLRIYYMNQKDHVSICNEFELKYIKGRWYEYYSFINDYFNKIDFSFYKIKTLLNYVRFSFHLSYSFKGTVNYINDKKNKALVIISYPFGVAFAIRDRINKRITH